MLDYKEITHVILHILPKKMIQTISKNHFPRFFFISSRSCFAVSHSHLIIRIQFSSVTMFRQILALTVLPSVSTSSKKK